ncbi:hypothetical protein [Actinomadura nitritigenes]|uniref:hypothetical protein n=1 Tax=Actinomadura nitritigenes TaxID=134602 RepID=UPI003D94B8F1
MAERRYHLPDKPRNAADGVPRPVAEAVLDGVARGVDRARPAAPAAPAPVALAAPPAGPGAPADPAGRRVLRIVLKKAEKVLEYHLADGSIRSEALLWYADFPPGAYVARALHDRPLHWAYPPQLSAYVAEGGRPYSVLTDSADHARNTGTFDGVEEVDFVVVGARTAPDGGTGPLDVDGLLNSAEIRRYLILRGRRRGTLPDRAPRDAAALPPDQILALLRLRDQLAGLTETDWARLAGHDLAGAGSWTAAQEQIDAYVRSAERAGALQAESARDAQIQAARADIDPAKEAAAVGALRGTGDLYDAIIESENTTSENSPAWAEAEALRKLMEALAASRFATVAEFDAAALRLRDVVGRQAVLHALLGLKEGERVLQAESQRYRDIGQVTRLATALHTAPVNAGEAGAVRVRTEYPLLRDKVVYDGARASTTLENLQELLEQNIEAQFRNVAKGRRDLSDDPDLVFRLDLVLDETLAAMNLPPDSVQAQLVRAGRGVHTVSGWDVLQQILTVLAFAAGPLGWIAYVANLAALGVQIGKSYEKERQKDVHRTFEHAGRPLASAQRIQGVLEWIDSVLEPLGIVGGALGVLDLPEPFGPAPAEGLPPVRPVPPQTPPGGAGPLAIPEFGPWVSRAERGVIEIRHSNQGGVLRITRDGYEVHLTPTSGTPTFSHIWERHDLPVSPRLLEQHPHLAGLHDIDRVTLGGRQFGIGVSPDGWFVYAPGTRNTLLTGRFPGAAADGAASVSALPGVRPQLALPPGDPARGLVDDLSRALAADVTIGRRILDPAGNAKADLELLRAARAPRPPVTALVPGLWERIDFARLRDDLQLPEARISLPHPPRGDEAKELGPHIRRVGIQAPDGSAALMERSYNTETGVFTLEYLRIDRNFPRRFVDIQPQLVPGLGVPLETYATIALMKWFTQHFGADFTVPRTVHLSNIINVESIAHLAQARLRGVPEETALLGTRTVLHAANSITQSGGRIVRAELSAPGEILPWEWATTLKERTDLVQSTGIVLPLDLPVRKHYDVDLLVEPATPPPPPTNP